MAEKKQEMMDGRESLLEFLSNYPYLPSHKVAIVGGHYILFYDKSDDSLKPAIWQDLQECEHKKKFAITMTGQFPLRTFQYAIEIYKNLLARGIESRAVLLVDDHKFQSRLFQTNIDSYVKNRGGSLRKAYYQKNQIPFSYQDALCQENIAKNDFLLPNDDDRRNAGHLLPRSCYFYSEQVLSKRFDHVTRKQLLKQTAFKEKKGAVGKDLYYQPEDSGFEFCLVEAGECACTGKVVEFSSLLLQKGYKNIIFFVPQECAEGVTAGLEAALHFFNTSCLAIVINGCTDDAPENNPLYNLTIVEDHKPADAYE